MGLDAALADNSQADSATAVFVFPKDVQAFIHLSSKVGVEFRDPEGHRTR